MALPLAEIFVVFIMIVLIFLYLGKNYGEVKYVRSTIDNKEYLVLNQADSQEAADILANLVKDLSYLVNHLVAKFPNDERVMFLYDNFDPTQVSESSIDSGFTSYSVSKKSLHICLKNKDGSFVLVNSINYVAIHELGHLMTKSIGHGEDFWANFKFILNEAIFIGIYTAIDYAKDPQDYCGIKINSTVL